MKIIPLKQFIIYLFITSVFACNFSYAGSARTYLDKGWNSLIQDHEIEALNYFGLALNKAQQENNKEEIAESLLNLGICTYSVSYSKGLEYSLKALKEYKLIEKTSPEKALQGRSKCLQLISTIYSRQGNYNEAISISKEAMLGFPNENDSTGVLGLIYCSLGNAYSKLNKPDSSEYFYRLALTAHLLAKNYTYLPNSYLNVANIELLNNNKSKSLTLYNNSLAIADSTGNRQSQVTALLGIGKWYLHFEKNNQLALSHFIRAKNIAFGLLDKSFYLNVLEKLIDFYKQSNDFERAFIYQEEMMKLKDSLSSSEKINVVKSLEVQFNLSEKDRKLKLLQKEKDISKLTNYLLYGSIAILIFISLGIILFLRRINSRDKLLLQTKEALVLSIEEQKKQKETHLQNEIEFKENQLSAMTFQMLQKNEIMLEIKDKLENEKILSTDNSINKILTKGLNHDKEWKDFNSYFESINKNFYAILKKEYPDISPNDLKICALIKLNLSTKEMAGILNISPDSVKTARYRLRKKLQLNTEDNLTDFILSI